MDDLTKWLTRNVLKWHCCEGFIPREDMNDAMRLLEPPLIQGWTLDGFTNTCRVRVMQKREYVWFEGRGTGIGTERIERNCLGIMLAVAKSAGCPVELMEVEVTDASKECPWCGAGDGEDCCDSCAATEFVCTHKDGDQ